MEDKDKKTSPTSEEQGSDNTATETSNPESLEQKVVELEQKNLELTEMLRMQVANERNSLKRRDEIEANLKRYGAKDLGQLLIPDLELLKKVLSSLENNDNVELKNYLMGFEMVVKKIDNNLGDVGIKPMTIKPGDEFNSQTQEAIEKVETDDAKPGTIVEVVNNGYMIHDRVLVYARVKIAEKVSEPKNEQENKEGDK